MNRLLCGSGFRGELVEVGEVLAYSQGFIEWKDREKLVSVDPLRTLDQFTGGKRRTNIGVLKMGFQVRQDGAQVREHSPVRVVVRKGDGWFHLPGISDKQGLATELTETIEKISKNSMLSVANFFCSTFILFAVHSG
jgi:hypothetical protein